MKFYPRSVRSVTWMCMMMSALVSCKSKTDAHPTNDGAMGIPVYVDGSEVGKIEAKLSKAQRLADWLPDGSRDIARWVRADVLGKDGHNLHLDKPSETFPNTDLWVYSDVQNRLAVGLFRNGITPASTPADPSERQPVQAFSGATQVRIQTAQSHGAKKTKSHDVPGKDIVVKIAGRGKKNVTAQKLAELPKAEGWGERLERFWLLGDVLSLVGVDAKATVIVRGDKDEVRLEPGSFGKADVEAFLRHNRRGKLRFAQWRRQGTETEQIAEIDDVIGIRVEGASQDSAVQ
ncbi:MAG: hypothetical protein R3C68_06555 [Myxococcota bacterium]